MKKVIKWFKSLVARFSWEEAKNVEFETLLNLLITVVCYTVALGGLVACLFGAWWHLFSAAMMYVLGAVCLNDTQWGNESALKYVERVFQK